MSNVRVWGGLINASPDHLCWRVRQATTYLIDHIRHLCLSGVLAQRSHNSSELFGGDGAYFKKEPSGKVRLERDIHFDDNSVVACAAPRDRDQPAQSPDDAHLIHWLNNDIPNQSEWSARRNRRRARGWSFAIADPPPTATPSWPDVADTTTERNATNRKRALLQTHHRHPCQTGRRPPWIQQFALQ